MTDTAPDPWGELNARYRHDGDAQFLLVADQLVEIRELLLSVSLAKLRLALVAVDNLADVLLTRHLRRIDQIASDPIRSAVPRLDAKQRQRFRGDFSYRVEIGLRGPTAGMAVHWLEPLLEPRDAAIFRTSHEYRNRVYHADHHNDRALAIITRIYMAAVCRAWLRQQPTEVGSSMTTWLRGRLDALGYDGDARAKGTFGSDIFEPAAAASTIGKRLCEDLQPTLASLIDELSTDISDRMAWANGMLDELARDMGGAEHVLRSLRWTDAWGQFEHDAELVRLTTELAMREATYDADYAARAELSDERNKRAGELLAQTSPRFEPAEIERISRAARGLRSARNVGALIGRYEKLDRRAEAVERLLDETAISWDRHIVEETDRIRGK